MSRDFASMVRGPRGFFVPRWALTCAVLFLVSLLGYVAFAPPSWTVQRLESPDGARTAVLSRTQFGRQHFVVKLKDSLAWRTVFVSPPITNSFREDLRERLFWSTNSSTLFFRMQDRVIWRRDF